MGISPSTSGLLVGRRSDLDGRFASEDEGHLSIRLIWSGDQHQGQIGDIGAGRTGFNLQTKLFEEGGRIVTGQIVPVIKTLALGQLQGILIGNGAGQVGMAVYAIRGETGKGDVVRIRQMRRDDLPDVFDLWVTSALILSATEPVLQPIKCTV